MNLACPECGTVYRIDPGRVAATGVIARCRSCGTHMRVEAGAAAPGVVHTAGAVIPPPATAASPAPAPGPAPEARKPGRAGAPAFGPQDPDTRAKRLARALVSDIVVYNRERWERSRSAGTLRTDFRDEILKSWEEFVEQVGEETAKKRPYFRDALNDILAEGESVF